MKTNFQTSKLSLIIKEFKVTIDTIISFVSRFLAYLLFRIFVGVLVLIYRWAIIHVYVSIIAILLYFDDMIDIK